MRQPLSWLFSTLLSSHRFSTLTLCSRVSSFFISPGLSVGSWMMGVRRPDFPASSSSCKWSVQVPDSWSCPEFFSASFFHVGKSRSRREPSELNLRIAAVLEVMKNGKGGAAKKKIKQEKLEVSKKGHKGIRPEMKHRNLMGKIGVGEKVIKLDN